MSYPASHINCTRIGSGPPVVMIHGNPATHTLWRPLAERVAAERTVYLVDLPGFGASPQPEDRGEYALANLARTILAVVDRHGIDRFDLVGHSFGGAVSITLTSLAPERVRTLVAITPMIDRKPPLAHLLDVPMVERIASSVWRTASSRFRRWFIRNWTHISYGEGWTTERAEEVAREADRGEIVRSVCGLMNEADYKEYGRCIAKVAAEPVPLLLVGAGRDKVIPHRQFEALRSRMSRAACHLFPESGHVPMYQYPDELARIVREFWRSAESAKERRTA